MQQYDAGGIGPGGPPSGAHVADADDTPALELLDGSDELSESEAGESRDGRTDMEAYREPTIKEKVLLAASTFLSVSLKCFVIHCVEFTVAFPTLFSVCIDDFGTPCLTPHVCVFCAGG